jgi:hypothetical protein
VLRPLLLVSAGGAKLSGCVGGVQAVEESTAKGVSVAALGGCEASLLPLVCGRLLLREAVQVASSTEQWRLLGCGLAATESPPS